jgi:hypothetical protein
LRTRYCAKIWPNVGYQTRAGEKYQKNVSGIVVGRRCKRLHFLHSAINAFAVVDGTEIGKYVVHYAGGQQREIPIVIGKELADWWNQHDEVSKPFVIAWSGTNAASRPQGRTIRLFKSVWENPLPELEVMSIDLVSTKEVGAPFLVAVTAECTTLTFTL